MAWTASVGCCVPRTSLAGTASVGRLRMSYRPTDRRIFASSDQPTFASSHLRTFAPSLVIHPILSLMMRKSLRIFPLTKPLPLRSRTLTRLTSLLSLATSQLVMATFSLSTTYGDGFGQLGPVPFYASPSTCPLVTVVARYLFSSRLSLHFYAVTATSTSSFGALRSTFGYGDTFTAILQLCASRSVPIILTPPSIPGIS